MLYNVQVTYRDLHAPKLSSHLASHLQYNLGSDSHECLRSAEGTGQHTLAGCGAFHTKVLLNSVVFVLPVADQDHHHLTREITGRSVLLHYSGISNLQA